MEFLVDDEGYYVIEFIDDPKLNVPKTSTKNFNISNINTSTTPDRGPQKKPTEVAVPKHVFAKSSFVYKEPIE
jgi:hypothetical protein